MKSIDRQIMSCVARLGVDKGLKDAAKRLHWSLEKVYSKYRELCPNDKRFPVILDLNEICGDRWKFADICREYQDAGYCIQSIAKLMHCSVANAEGWIRVSRTFPLEFRYPELAPSVYFTLVDMPDPIEAVQFARDEQFTVAKAIQARKAYVRHKRLEGRNMTGRPFSLVDMDKFVELYKNGLTDSEIAEKLNISRATVIRYKRDIGLPSTRKIGERGKAKKSGKISVIKTIDAKTDIKIDPLDAVRELTARLDALETENRALRKQCMTYLGQLKSINARRVSLKKAL